jgi:hypothetical protein
MAYSTEKLKKNIFIKTAFAGECHQVVKITVPYCSVSVLILCEIKPLSLRATLQKCLYGDPYSSLLQ